MLMLEVVRFLTEIVKSIKIILEEMKNLEKKLEEYNTIRSMAGFGDTLAPMLIALISSAKINIICEDKYSST